MFKFVKRIKELINGKKKQVYRHGTCYKLFVGRIYCIQKKDWLGDFHNIFESLDKKAYENKVLEMLKSGIKFKN
jgi:hypothetical protein